MYWAGFGWESLCQQHIDYPVSNEDPGSLSREGVQLAEENRKNGHLARRLTEVGQVSTCPIRSG